MIFFVEIPDATFKRAMVNRQTVAKRIKDLLNASSPIHQLPLWSGDDPPWEDFVFFDVKVKPITRERETKL